MLRLNERLLWQRLIFFIFTIFTVQVQGQEHGLNAKIVINQLGFTNLFSFLQKDSQFQSFLDSLSEGDFDLLMRIKGYVSRDQKTFFFVSPISLLKETAAFSLMSHYDFIRAANKIHRLLWQRSKLIEATRDNYLGLLARPPSHVERHPYELWQYLRSHHDHFDDMLKSIHLIMETPISSANTFALDSFAFELTEALIEACSTLGIAVEIDPKNTLDSQKTAELVYKVFSFGAVRISASIGVGFSVAEAKMIGKVTKIFSGLNFSRYQVGGDMEDAWELGDAKGDYLHLSVLNREDFGSTLANSPLDEMFLAARLQSATVNGLRGLKIPALGSYVQLELPYFAALSYGLIRNHDGRLSEENEEALYYFLPGRFRKTKEIEINANGQVRCRFVTGKGKDQKLYQLSKKDGGVIFEGSDLIFNGNSSTMVSCAFEALVDGKNLVFSDTRGQLIFDHPLLARALGVSSLNLAQQEKAILNLNKVISEKMSFFSYKYGLRLAAAQSLKDALMAGALVEYNSYVSLPLPENLKNESWWETFRSCYKEVNELCVKKPATKWSSYAWGYFYDKPFGFRYNCDHEVESQCKIFSGFEQAFYSESLPEYFFSEAEFKVIDSIEEVYPLRVKTNFEVTFEVPNEVCLSFKGDRNSSSQSHASCTTKEARDLNVRSQQDLMSVVHVDGEKIDGEAEIGFFALVNSDILVKLNAFEL